MFNDAESAGYVLLVCNYGLRDERLTDLPKPGMIGIADIMEHSHRAIQNERLDSDAVNECTDGNNISELKGREKQ